MESLVNNTGVWVLASKKSIWPLLKTRLSCADSVALITAKYNRK
jgi:hypothetical protein